MAAGDDVELEQVAEAAAVELDLAAADELESAPTTMRVGTRSVSERRRRCASSPVRLATGLRRVAKRKRPSVVLLDAVLARTPPRGSRGACARAR